MKILLSFLLLFNISLQSQNQKEAISRIETKRYEAMTTKDTNYLKFILADDLVYTHSNGLVESKSEFIQSIIDGKIVYGKIGIKEQKVRCYDRTAIINGVLHVEGSLNGKEFSIDLRYTNVYIKNTDWKLVTWQSLKI